MEGSAASPPSHGGKSSTRHAGWKMHQNSSPTLRPDQAFRTNNLLLVLVVAATMILQHSTAAEGSGNSSLAKFGCRDSCGNVSIPYPFGIGKGCFMEGFEVHCSLDNIAILDTSSTPLLEINLTFGEVRVQNYIARACDTTKLGPDMTALLPVRRSFMVSRTKNIFTAIGCSTIAYISGDVKTPIEDEGNSTFYSVNACGSFCDEDSVDSSTDCSGRGCCQSSIPRNLKSFVPAFLPNSHSSPQSFSPCSYAFVNEVDWFKFDPSYVRSPHIEYLFGFGPPLVLDWVFGSAPCEAATGTSACAATNSMCIDVPSGHRCSCSPGYEGNPYLAGGCQDINECDSPSTYPCHGECRNTDGSYICSCPARTRSSDPKKIPCTAVIGISIGIGVGSAAGFILLVLIAIYIIRRMKHRRETNLKRRFFQQNRGQLLEQLVSHRADIAEKMIIKVDELAKATNNFDKARELGGGGHGTVYKGIMLDLQVVAIKKSKITVRKEIDEFINEVAILSQINHRNVVKLYGCCLETEVPLLVYEFISNGTLYHHLHVEGPRSLSWGNRLRIAAETAGAIAYLHSSVSIPIIHRDIKSTNILLNDSMTSKVSDFGASRYVPMDKSGLTTMVQGTIGYLDPMYFYTGRLTDKSDVYSFGVVLVELLTRKKTFTYLSSEGEGLVADFASLHVAGNLVQILDPQVVEEGGQEIQEVAQLAASCIKLRGEDRPTMKQVNRSLEGILSSEKCGG